MQIELKHTLWRLLWVGLSFLCAAHAWAQSDHPNKPVRLLDPYAPGGSTSVVSRVLAQQFQQQTGQPIVVDYKPGAGSNIGSDLVAKALPDGYTRCCWAPAAWPSTRTCTEVDILHLPYKGGGDAFQALHVPGETA